MVEQQPKTVERRQRIAAWYEKVKSCFFECVSCVNGWLAACCIIAPLVFGYVVPNTIADVLMPLKENGAPFSYVFADTQGETGRISPSIWNPGTPAVAIKAALQDEHLSVRAAQDRLAWLPASTNRSEFKEAYDDLAKLEKAFKQREASLAKQEAKFVADLFAGAYGYVAASGFLYVVSFATCLLASLIILAGKRPCRYEAYGVGLVAMVAVAYYATTHPTTHEHASRLLLGRLLQHAEGSGWAISLSGSWTRPSFSLSEKIDGLVFVNTLIGLVAVGLALLAFAALATGPPTANVDVARKQALEQRLKDLRRLIVLSSVLLMVATVACKTLLDWPLKLLATSPPEGLQPLAQALTNHLGVSGTIALFAAVTPAVIAYSRDVEVLRVQNAQLAEGLDFAPATIVTTIVAILGPASISTLFTAFQTAFGVFGQAR